MVGKLHIKAQQYDCNCLLLHKEKSIQQNLRQYLSRIGETIYAHGYEINSLTMRHVRVPPEFPKCMAMYVKA